MKSMTAIKKSMITAVCIALCVVLPMAFHSIPNAGTLLSPMHLPVLLCGLVCGWPFGLLCGLAGPILSSLITGMPPMAYLPSMLIELAIYGLVAGLLMQLLHTGRLFADLYVSLAAAMLAGRMIAGIAKALIFAQGSYSIGVWATSYFVSCLPAIIIQLALLPALCIALEKARLIPVRYPKQAA